MEAVVQSPTQNADELRFLLEWETAADRSRWREAGLLSVALHILAVLALVLLPQAAFRPSKLLEAPRITPLVAPPAELTQTAPNRGKISKEFNVEALLPRPRIQIPPSPPSTTRPAAPTLSMPAPTLSAPALPEPPKIEAADQPRLPPQIQSEERPKLAFESPGSPPLGSKGQGPGKVAAPGGSVSEAMRSVARGGSSGGLIVGDIGVGAGGVGEGINLPPSPGRQGSNLELLSDPLGVDFRPYLLQILATVRRNWFSVMPESARLGRRGKVALQFAVSRDGNVAKVVFATNSGADALDRAAVASISMSNPFPPLPPEFRGNQIRLQFTFLYNMLVR